MTQPLRKPDAARIQSTALYKSATTYFDGDANDYDALWQWSVDEIGDFWSAVWDFTGVIGDKGATPLTDTGNIKTTQFFPNAKLNYAENLLRHRHP